MTDRAYSRRTFLTATVGLAAAGAWAAIVLPGVRALVAASAQPLPAFAYATPRTVRAYRVALAEPRLLESLPCYCGCGRYSPAHRSLLDCFITPAGDFEQHAAGCTTCQDEALDARQWAAAGLAPADVRRRIDAAYADRGPGTDTPHTT